MCDAGLVCDAAAVVGGGRRSGVWVEQDRDLPERRLSVKTRFNLTASGGRAAGLILLDAEHQDCCSIGLSLCRRVNSGGPADCSTFYSSATSNQGAIPAQSK